MKKIVIINSVNQAKDISSLVDGYILPIDKFSINYQNTFSIEDISLIPDKEVFVLVNKNIHNNELKDLEKLLTHLDKLNINGIIFYDQAVLNIKNKLGLKTDLVWFQEHFSTNYHSVNYYYSMGCNYAFLSSELSKEEITKIALNSKAKLFIMAFGYNPMFTSRRHLVQNYINYFSKENKKGQKKISKEGNDYLIEDKENGTTIYSSYILNILDEDLTKFDYVVYNANYIKEDEFKKILTDINAFPINHGFLYERVIYKVKKDE